MINPATVYTAKEAAAILKLKPRSVGRLMPQFYLGARTWRATRTSPPIRATNVKAHGQPPAQREVVP